MSYRIEGSIDAARDLHALTAGELALALLAASSRGVLAAKFEHSVYARFESGVFVCVGMQAIGDGPLNVLLGPADWPHVSAVPLGETVEADAGSLHFGHRVRVVLTRAQTWRPRRTAPRCEVISKRLATLLPLAQRLAPEMGLSRLAFAPDTGGDADPLLSFARPAWDALECWLPLGMAAPADIAAPAPIISRLIGLGPGLTPSGDDVFCGVLVALTFLGFDRPAAALWSWLLPQLEPRTSALSAAHLRAAATGQGHAALHAALECMADEASAMEDALRGLGDVGHCSGWDALAGVVLVCRAHAAQAATSRIASSAA